MAHRDQRRRNRTFQVLWQDLKSASKHLVFRAESYVPCYGLAESSVALAFPPINRRPVIDTIRRDLFEKNGCAEKVKTADTNRMHFVANGKPMPNHEVKIVDEEGQELAERMQGRLLFRGPSKTSGYYRNPKATACVLTEDGWMDSGDFGLPSRWGTLHHRAPQRLHHQVRSKY